MNSTRYTIKGKSPPQKGILCIVRPRQKLYLKSWMTINWKTSRKGYLKVDSSSWVWNQWLNILLLFYCLFPFCTLVCFEVEDFTSSDFHNMDYHFQRISEGCGFWLWDKVINENSSPTMTTGFNVKYNRGYVAKAHETILIWYE